MVCSDLGFEIWGGFVELCVKVGTFRVTCCLCVLFSGVSCRFVCEALVWNLLFGGYGWVLLHVFSGLFLV